ncbi:MAG: hypothetical protein JNM22_22345 [Saprospiraceae bacterium]|nr:hypothetical protein [Saprospiraceae bacterium]
MEQAFIWFFRQIMEEEYVSDGKYSHLEYAAFKAFILHSNDLCAYMRNQRNPLEDAYETGIFTICDFINKNKGVKASGKILYRGTRLPNSIFEHVIQSGYYSDCAFLSTSDSLDDAKRFVVMDQHEDPQETHTMVLFSIVSHCTGVDISDLSLIHGIDGKETIFNPGTVFKVMEVKQTFLPNETARIVYEITLEEEVKN